MIDISDWAFHCLCLGWSYCCSSYWSSSWYKASHGKSFRERINLWTFSECTVCPILHVIHHLLINSYGVGKKCLVCSTSCRHSAIENVTGLINSARAGHTRYIIVFARNNDLFKWSSFDERGTVGVFCHLFNTATRWNLKLHTWKPLKMLHVT